VRPSGDVSLLLQVFKWHWFSSSRPVSYQFWTSARYILRFIISLPESLGQTPAFASAGSVATVARRLAGAGWVVDSMAR
jgi:hypothetical protein